MGNGVSRIETEMRRLDNERKKDFNKLWDKVAMNRDGIIKEQENIKMLGNIMIKQLEEGKGLREDFKNGTIHKDEFMKAMERFATLQQITIGLDYLVVDLRPYIGH